MAAHIVIEENDKKIEFENGWLSIKKYSSETLKLHDGSNFCYIGQEKYSFPIVAQKMEKRRLFLSAWHAKEKKTE